MTSRLYNAPSTGIRRLGDVNLSPSTPSPIDAFQLSSASSARLLAIEAGTTGCLTISTDSPLECKPSAGYNLLATKGSLMLPCITTPFFVKYTLAMAPVPGEREHET